MKSEFRQVKGGDMQKLQLLEVTEAVREIPNPTASDLSETYPERRALALEQIQEALKFVSQVRQSRGIEGDIFCDSCCQKKSSLTAIVDEATDYMICGHCFLEWANMFLDGYVARLSDIVPRGELYN